MDPVDNSVYVGGAQGGVWKSTDNGATWTALTDGLSWLAVGSIAIDPASHTAGNATIYVGTGEGNGSCDSYGGVGVYNRRQQPGPGGAPGPVHRDDVVERPVVHDGEHRRQRRPREVGEQRLELDPGRGDGRLAGLAITGAAAMGGSTVGLQAVVNDTGALFVQDDLPNNEPRYRTRLYINPNTFDPGAADSHFRVRVMIGFNGAGERLVALVLKRQGGQCSIEGRVRRNDGTRTDTGFISITNAAHFIEFDWIKASTGLANGTFTLVLDQFVSRRVNYNGPES